MKCKLTPRLSSGDWNEFCSRFHFPPDDMPHIQAIYTALLPLVESYAHYSLDQDLDGVSLPHYAYGFVTLGNGVDELSELYLNHEQIQEAYIVDCISLMLLSKACLLQNYLFWEIPIPLTCSHRFMGGLPRMASSLPRGRCSGRLRQQR